MNQRHITAIHEAGHVVICKVLGYQVGSVDVYEDGSGRTRHIEPPTPWEQAVIAMAGPIAEQRFCGTDYDPESSRGDLSRVAEISGLVSDLTERCQFIETVEQLTRNRVAAYWREIVATAHDLVREESLSV